MKTRYYILDEDEPTCMWRVYNNICEVFYSVHFPWVESICLATDFLKQDNGSRQITKREAKYLFPEAFK